MDIIVYRRRKKRSSTTVEVPYLCEEIIFNILSKLPFDLEIINSCRLVSKLWYNLTYKIHQPKPTRLLIQNPTNIDNSTRLMELNEERNQAIGLRDLNFNSFGTIKATCNGLVLIQRYNNDHVHDRSFLLTVLNPLTRQCIELPPYNLSRLTEWCYGIAFVPSSREYKVLAAYAFRKSFRCEILTLGSSEGNWRTITMPAIRKSSLSSTQQPVSVNGILHLKTGSRNHLISIDAGDETLHKTKLPNGRIVLKNMHLCEMRRSLGLIQNYYVLMDIWFLEDFRKGEWTYIGRIDLVYPRPNISFRVQLVPVASFRNGNIIIFKLLYVDYKALLSLNIEQREMKRIEVEINDDTVCFPYTVAPYFLPGA